MARKETPRYIRFYTDGSAARQLELPQNPKSGARPKRAKKPQVVQLDGLVVIGLVVAAVMAVCLIAGSIMTARAEHEMNALITYVDELETANEALTNEYAAGYDLDDVRVTAQAMGLVPAEQVQHITVELPVPEEVPELTWWQQLVADLKSLFA